MPCDLRLRVALGFGVAVVDVVEDGGVVADDDAVVDVDDDAVEDATDVAGAGAASMVGAEDAAWVAAGAASGVVVGGDSLVVFLAAGVALVLVAGLAFLAGLGVDLALDFSLVFGRFAWGLALGRRDGVGEWVLRLDFMGCVWRGLRGVGRHTVTVSRPAWELINRCPQCIHRHFRRTQARS